MMNYKTLLLTLLLAVGLARPWSAHAGDAIVGDGTPASCTESAFDTALTEANNGGGSITFNCGSTPTTITFTVQKIINLGSVTIEGDNLITLEASPNERLFFVGNGLTFTLRHITLQNGDSLASGGAIEASDATVALDNVRLLNNRSVTTGGAIYCFNGTITINQSFLANNTSGTGGAIFNDGCLLTITRSTFDNNSATDGSGRGGAIQNAPLGNLFVTNTLFTSNQALDGGALFVDSGSAANLTAVTLRNNSGGYGGGAENNGTLNINNSLIENNSVTGSGGGVWNFTGGILNLYQTTVQNNSAYEGGGINSYGGQVTMQDVNVVGNIATNSHGGGIYHGGGTFNVTNATISGNMASDAAANGGGIYQNSDDNLTLTNVTLANNQAGFFGGGFYHYGRYAVLTNVTIANNLAGAAGDAIYEDSPMTVGNPGVVQIANSVIFGSSNNCDGPAFQSLGNNISTGSCTALSHGTDQQNYSGDLLLGPLAFNGGRFIMQTYLPQLGSPLIDAADATQCFATDQRSALRVSTCDIGAVEYGASTPYLFLPLVVR